VFPTAVSQIDLAWGNAGEAATITVNLTYDSIKVTGVLRGSRLEQDFRQYSTYTQSAYESFSSSNIGFNISDIVDRTVYNIFY